MDINWEERINGTERLGFSVTETQAAFHYSYPKKSLDKICLKCKECSTITPWCVGDFYKSFVKQSRVYTCRACKKYTLKTIQQKIDNIFGEGLILVAPDQKYIGIRKPLRFIDRDYGEWTTPPFNLITNKNTHPERSKERRKQTNLVKYGHENAFGSKQIQEKIRKTNLEKYGVENPMHDSKIKQKQKESNVAKYGCAVPLVGNKEVLDKVKQTNLERYGTENPAHSAELQKNKVQTNLERYGYASPFQNEDVKEKIRQTNIDNLGVEYPTQSEEVREKVKETFRRVYGCDHPMQTEEMKKRVRKSNLEKYGVESIRQIDCPRLPNGLLISQYLAKYNSPLHQTTCKNVYLRHGFDVLRKYVEFGRTFGKDTSLELAFEAAYDLKLYKKNIKKPYRYPDFKLTDTTFVDIDGLYYHSALVKDNEYHRTKRLGYEAEGLRLIQVREDEFMERPEVVRSILFNELGKNKTVGARKCQIAQVPWSEASIFLDQNHLQGAGANAICYGLYYDKTLLMLMGVRRYQKILDISRLCTLVFHQVQGGFSRLLAHVIKVHQPAKVISWCDLRYATGKGYEAIGFRPIRETLGWCWTDMFKRYNRRSCRANMDKRGLSEREYMKEFGYARIYDAGQRRYELAISKD
jgi:hypothetical protein